MKKILFVIPILASCGLFQKKNHTQPQAPETKSKFGIQSVAGIKTALTIEYVINRSGEESSFTVFPYSDTGYSFEYMSDGGQGSFRCDAGEIAAGNLYTYDLTGGHTGPGSGLSGWLGKRNFDELKLTGETRMNIGGEGEFLFKISGTSKYNILLGDSTIQVPVVELRSEEKPYFMSFIPDPEYPLITFMEIGYTRYITSIVNAEGPWSEFQPAEGMNLTYRLIEAGVNEYEIRLRNTVWTTNEIRFDLSGSYSSQSYSYNFHYDMIYRGKALNQPDFLLPVLSAVTGEKIEDTTNWVFVRKNEINAMELKHHGYLSVPHYAENPDDDPEMYDDTAEYNLAKKDFTESYQTHFVQQRIGRLNYADYLYFDRDWEDERALPALRMTSEEHGMEMMVLNRGLYPLVLYYNDGQLYELMLESAGMNAEED